MQVNGREQIDMSRPHKAQDAQQVIAVVVGRRRRTGCSIGPNAATPLATTGGG